LIQIGTAKPSPIRYAYPSIQDMEADWSATQWSQDDPLKRYQQQKAFAAGWFKFFDGKDCEEFLRGHKHDNGLLRADTIKSLVKENTEQKDERAITDILIAIASDQATYFKDSDGTLYAEIVVDNHTEVHQVKSKGYDQWLRREYYILFKKGCSSLPLNEAILTVEAKFLWDCEIYTVFVRVGGDSDTIYIDLCNAAYEIVAITDSGYQVIKKSPVKFRRSSGMLPLPHPVGGGSLALLRDFLNLKNPKDWILVAAWIIASLRPKGPYGILCGTGEQGSAKSTGFKHIRAVTDPSTTPLRNFPREGRDLMVSAHNSWVLAFDNMSHTPVWLSDQLCQVANGGGFSVRTLYSDLDETLVQYQRPIMLNGINNVVAEPDLADRTLIIPFAPISEADRLTEEEIFDKFAKVRPQIFGALCQAASTALRNYPTINLPGKPRMADFAKWSVAAEPAYCQPGEFLKAYSGNRQNSIDESLAASPVMDAILKMTDAPDFRYWEGTPSELLELLNEKAGEKIQRSKAWPKEPAHLTRKLNKAEPQLRSRGISIEHDRDKKRRKIRLVKACQVTVTTVTGSKKESQPSVNINDFTVTVENKLPSFSVKLPSPGKVTVTSLNPYGDGNFTPGDSNNMTAPELPSPGNIFKNQALRSQDDGNDGNDGKNNPFNNGENFPINSKAPEKPQVRIVI
jgi:hypothetical protein